MTLEDAKALKVFYDGDCPRCRRLADRYTKLDAESRLDWLDLNTSRDELSRVGIDSESALARLHVARADGRVFAGVEALGEIWRVLPQRRWLERLLRIPLIRKIAAAVYGFVARGRLRETRPR